MGKMGSICHFPCALPASIWEHCSQALVLTSNWGADNGTFRAVFPSIRVTWDPKHCKTKENAKRQIDPVLPPSHNREFQDGPPKKKDRAEVTLSMHGT